MTQPPPNWEQQAQLYRASADTRMNKADHWFLIHHTWFETWASACSIPDYTQPEGGALKTSPPPENPRDIPPIDNSLLLDDNLLLRRGISIGIDCHVVPEPFWNLLSTWYGLKDSHHAIPRRVIAPSGPGSESVEFYPPAFIFHLLVPSNLNQATPAQFDPAERDSILSLPNHPLKQNFSIDFSLQDLKKHILNSLIDHHSKAILSRSFRLWSVHTPPADPDSLLLTVDEFQKLDTQHIQPASGDQADLNEALLTEPINRVAIEHQGSDGEWLIDQTKTTNQTGAAPSTPSDPSPNGFGGQAWLDRMEEMNQANAADPKFLLTSPTTSLLLADPSRPATDLLSQLKWASSPASKPRGIRGLVGLSNLGNTCFMNSALQCLSNCPELKRYFLSRVYISELNRTNPLGMGGKVAETFGQLIERMWSSEFEVINSNSLVASGSNSINTYNHHQNSQFRSISPREFKSIVGRFNSLFLGYGQQDSQELLTFLLDALHEDLNRVKVKPFDEIPDYDDSSSSTNNPLEESEKILNLAKTCWNLYRRRNDSVIVDLFQGQYKSTLICPDCNKVAIKFDEIMYLTLQLPINKKIRGSIYFIPLDLSKPRIKVTYLMNKDSTIRKLKQHIGKILGADPNNMAAIEDWSGKPWKIWQDTDSIDGIMERDVINVFETPLPFATLKSGVFYSNEQESADLLIPVISYRPAERSIMGAGTSSLKPNRITFGIFFVARISAKDRMSYRSVYNAVAREYARYTTQADELFEPASDEDVEMSDTVAGEPTTNSERQAVANLFKIFVPKTPCPMVFPTSNAMESTPIELEERIQLSVPKSTVSTPPAAPAAPAEPDGDSTMTSSNGAVFETEEKEDLYEDNSKQTQSTAEALTPVPIVHQGDYFECEWNSSSVGHFFGLDKTLNSSKNWIDPPLTEDPELVAARAEAVNNKKPKGLTIEECFKDFSKPEKLGEDDKWYCPRCKNHVQATKQMQIWKVPDILVVHFKRFSSARTSYGRSTKVDAFVDFPIEGLDLSDQVEGIKVMRDLKLKKRQLMQDDQTLDVSSEQNLSPSESKLGDQHTKEKEEGPSEIKNTLDDQVNDEKDQIPDGENNREDGGDEEDKDEQNEDESLIYDLFAVDNHFGGLGGGHYTAFAKNEEDGKWHNYDDSHVTEVSSPEQVISSAAYLLFYRRRTSRKLGLKTHGIVRSAMQSRDISVSPSEERKRNEGEVTPESDEKAKFNANREDQSLEIEREEADGEEDSIGAVGPASCPSDRCNSFSSRSDHSPNINEEDDDASSLINNLGDASSICSRKSLLLDPIPNDLPLDFDDLSSDHHPLDHHINPPDPSPVPHFHTDSNLFLPPPPPPPLPPPYHPSSH